MVTVKPTFTDHLLKENKLLIRAGFDIPGKVEKIISLLR